MHFFVSIFGFVAGRVLLCLFMWVSGLLFKPCVGKGIAFLGLIVSEMKAMEKALPLFWFSSQFHQ